MQDDAENVVNAVLAAARNGDMTAARIILDRIAPARRDNPVSFDLPKIENASDAVAASSAILNAVASGNLTPSEAGEVSRLVGNIREDFGGVGIRGAIGAAGKGDCKINLTTMRRIEKLETSIAELEGIKSFTTTSSWRR